jgi:predicted transcriptional regulator
MKSEIRKQLDEKGEEIADVLTSLSLSRPITKTLSYLKDLKEATSVELERVTGLRQPEVSIAMRELKERDWINEREEKKPGKGRPFKIYSLKMDFIEIIAHFEKQKMIEFNEIQSNIERLKDSITIVARSYSGEAYPAA